MLVGAFGTVYTVPLVPDPDDAAGPDVPPALIAEYAVIDIGPYPVFGERPLNVALVAPLIV